MPPGDDGRAQRTVDGAADGAGEVTIDTLLRGRVTLVQPARGFRSSLDPVLLAAFVAPPFGRFVDIGCGTGAVAFLLAARDPDARGVAVELQPRLAALARMGLARNTFTERLEIREGDIRTTTHDGTLPHGAFELVVSNPPFRSTADGPPSPDQERAVAHHELTLNLDALVACAAALLAPTGRLAAIHAASRLDEILAALPRNGLTPTRLRMIHPYADRPATRVLFEARPNASHASPLVTEHRLVLHSPGGTYTPEVDAILNGDR